MTPDLDTKVGDLVLAWPQAMRYLEAQGFTQVFNVREGMAGSAAGPGWLRRGLPLQ